MCIYGKLHRQACCKPWLRAAPWDSVADQRRDLIVELDAPPWSWRWSAVTAILTCGHALVQNLGNGCSSPTAHVPRPLHLTGAWPLRARAI